MILAELSDGALDAKAVAMLGVLAACGAVMRLPNGGLTGFEEVYQVIERSCRGLLAYLRNGTEG